MHVGFPCSGGGGMLAQISRSTHGGGAGTDGKRTCVSQL